MIMKPFTRDQEYAIEHAKLYAFFKGWNAIIGDMDYGNTTYLRIYIDLPDKTVSHTIVLRGEYINNIYIIGNTVQWDADKLIDTVKYLIKEYEDSIKNDRVYEHENFKGDIQVS